MLRLKNLSIKNKFIVILLIFMVLPTCVLFGWTYKKVSGNWIEKEYVNQSNELGNILKTTELQLNEYETIAYKIYQSGDRLKTVKTEQEKRIPLNYVQMTNYLRGIQGEDAYIESVYFFSEKDEVFLQDSHASKNYVDKYESMNWESGIREKNGAVTWIPTYILSDNKGNELRYFSCAVLVKDLDSSAWKPLGIFVLNIDLSLFSDLFELLGQQGDVTTYLIADDNGSIIWSNHLNAAEQVDDSFFSEIKNSEESCSEQSYKGEPYVVTKLRSSYNGWNYISMKRKAEVTKSANWVLTMIILQLFLIILGTILGGYMMQYYIIHPIQKMVVAMSVPEQELMGKRLTIDQEDEIGKLYQSFNEMNARIENFIEKNREMNKKEKEYQIQALNAQINPHFIYNTLDTLHWMAMDIPAPDICRLITSFSDILRYSISKKESMVTLKDEIACIQNYINIYEERYEMPLGKFDIDERIYPYKTFKMLLQPIIENCIVHGFAKNMDQAVIEVTGCMEEEDAVIKIRDNGSGISQERIDYVLSTDSDRVGLSNINQRLKLLYGEEYSLKIISAKGEGTTIILRFPKASLGL